MKPVAVETAELTPTQMGGQGDAIAAWQGRRVFIPYVLPGERVRATLHPAPGGDFTAREVELLSPAPDRIAPACRHFGTCGGCAVQHWAEAPYRAWKIALLDQALAHRGLERPKRFEARFLAPATRRRAEFAATRQGGSTLLGFHAAGSDVIVDQLECPILSPTLARLVVPLRAVLAEVLRGGETLDVLVTETATGFDLLVTADRAPNPAQRTALAAFATAHDVARIGWRGSRGSPEPIVLLRAPQARFGEVAVDLPMPSFLQPSAAGEAALRAALLEVIGKPKRMVELFAGCGTFTFDLARIGKVHAVEGGKTSIAALDQAARRAQLGHRITTEVRDLERAPLSLQELKGVEAVVFDPPHAGARAQSEVLAKSKVPAVVGISCNAATFARDARILADGGYRLAALTLVDQFVWSPHIELVAQFEYGR